MVPVLHAGTPHRVSRPYDYVNLRPTSMVQCPSHAPRPRPSTESETAESRECAVPVCTVSPCQCVLCVARTAFIYILRSNNNAHNVRILHFWPPLLRPALLALHRRTAFHPSAFRTDGEARRSARSRFCVSPSLVTPRFPLALPLSLPVAPSPRPQGAESPAVGPSSLSDACLGPRPPSFYLPPSSLSR